MFFGVKPIGSHPGFTTSRRPSLLHDRDTRVNRNGFGLGTILLVSDPESGAPIAYGWVGLKWRAFETDIALGHPVD